MKIWLVIVLAIPLLIGCDGSKHFEQINTLPPEGWDVNNRQSFTFDISDNKTPYNVFIDVRNKNEYAYKNLFLFLEWTGPDSVFVRDTFECVLAGVDGRWYGNGFGDLWDARVPYKMNLQFPKEGEYTIEIEQAMRHENLEGISEIGLRIEKTKANN